MPIEQLDYKEIANNLRTLADVYEHGEGLTHSHSVFLYASTEDSAMTLLKAIGGDFKIIDDSGPLLSNGSYKIRSMRMPLIEITIPFSIGKTAVEEKIARLVRIASA